MKKVLPANLTSYDFLKCAALLLMIVDHIGYYFYPDDGHLWVRAVGRLSAPIWLFLIGYAKSRDFSARMWIGIAVLVVTDYIVGAGILPLTILSTMLICRAVLDPVMDGLKRKPETLYPFCTFLFLATFMTFPFIEYGTEVLMMVMLGYMTRNRETIPYDNREYFQFAVLATLAHAFYQAVIFFPFDIYQKLFVALGLMAVTMVLIRFRPVEYPALTQKLTAPVVWLLRLGGRRTLEIYVAHLVILRFLALYLGEEGYSWLNFRIWD